MKKIFMTGALSALIMLSACAETPKEVKSDITIYDNAEKIDTVKIRKASLETVLKDAGVFKNVNKTNINVDNIILPVSTKMPEYTVDFISGENEGKFFSMQNDSQIGNDGGQVVSIQNDIEKWKQYGKNIFSVRPTIDMDVFYRKGQEIMISDGTYYGYNMCKTEHGLITLFPDGTSLERNSAHSYNAVKRYYDNFEKIEESFCLCDGKEVTVSKIAEYAEDFCKRNFSPAEHNLFEYKTDYIDARKITENKYGYYVSLCRVDSYGNRFDSTYIYDYVYDAFKDKNALMPAPIYLWITESDEIVEFERHYSLSLTESADNDSFVPLDNAAEILSYTLAQGKSYNFNIAELKYIFEFTESDYIDAARKAAIESNENDATVIYSVDSIYAYGDYEIKAVPYWVFAQSNSSGSDTNSAVLYMVNAVDGSVRIENENIKW